MRKSKLSGALIVLMVISLALPAGAITEFPIDKNHSTIGFSVSIMGLSKVRGKFTDFTVSLNYDEQEVTRSSVKVAIKVASIDTGIEGRDKHLRTADFFDADKYPEITFQCSRIEKRGDSYIAHGVFTMRGITREIALPFRITGRNVSDSEKEPGKKLLVMGFAAATTLNRQDYGVSWKHDSVPGFVADEIEIEINLLTRAVPMPAK